MTTITLRIPRGLWQDLEATVIQQDRQFLMEVARTLGLPVQDVLRKCLGTGGVPTTIPALWSPPQSDEPTDCPWWECHGDEMWRRCPRKRLSPTLPCVIHERTTPCPMARLHTDPAIQAMPRLQPVSVNGELFWIDPATGVARGEDGFLSVYTFKQITVGDESVWLKLKPAP